MTSASRHLFPGLLWAATAIFIWSGSLILLRLGVSTGLTAYDLTALRFGVAAAILLPVILRQGISVHPPGWIPALVLIALFGAPYVLMLSLAVKTAPAAATGALNPGVMAIAAVIIARVSERQPLTPARRAGIALTALGVSGFVLTGGGISAGHRVLMATGVMWAGYAAVIRATRLPALNATALVAVGSAVLYLPVYAVALPKQIAATPLPDLLLQAFFQGFLVTTVAVYAFNRSAELLGSVAATSLPALMPVVTLGLEVLVLGQTPTSKEMISACLVTAGIALLLAGPALAAILRRRSPAGK
ncbi:hypothetical protein Sant_0712 [Sodalis praecaptivus]|uniref:EamA domain-containing protein n=1 Tax=Sodalis praecaptivus TaxID=1239307 RepID=W0HUH8_9GAMM|nr:DMT family transporter [Sodalis praecaptivus]AHF75808.1 hypothetical protein Sant_0712 [Sodalis praecaptivus]